MLAESGSVYVLQPSSLTCPLLCWGCVFPPVFQNCLQDGQLYAFKGLSGRLGPIGVHIALLMCLFGTGYSGFGGWKGTALCPEGGEFVVANALYPASSISTLPKGSKAVMQVGAGLRQYTAHSMQPALAPQHTRQARHLS
jgi:hypothetical protein